MGVESVPEVIPNFEFWAGIPSLVKVNRSRFYQDIAKRLTRKTWNPGSRKVLAVESEFLGFENWNTAHGMLLSGILLTIGFWNPVIKIRNPRHGIQNPRLS